MRVVAFKAEDELLMALDLYALNKRMSRSEVIREAIRKLLEEPPTGLEPATTGSLA
jgi:Ribbon-helix-helix protein, copG family.